jgi:hypothetical protein
VSDTWIRHNAAEMRKHRLGAWIATLVWVGLGGFMRGARRC